MRIQPDDEEASREQAVVAQTLRTALRNTSSQCGIDNDEPVARLFIGGASSAIVPDVDLLCYPGSVAVAYDAQQVRRAGTARSDQRRRLMAQLQEVAARAQLSAQRAQDCMCPMWHIDLATPEPHLRESLARAVAQIPKTPERANELMKMTVADWQDEQRAVFCSAGCLLALVWPEMLAEMTVVVRQVALLQGYGIDGFTDFTTHGVVFVNQRRCEPTDDGPPPEVQLAEALVHEATHNRCNAAALSRPFLHDSDTTSQPMVVTPLRSDPRPLTGLFQQLAVLARCLVLYDRLVGHAVSDGQALDARHERLLRQAWQALETMQRHSDMLTGHGCEVVAEAEGLLRRQISGASI